MKTLFGLQLMVLFGALVENEAFIKQPTAEKLGIALYLFLMKQESQKSQLTQVIHLFYTQVHINVVDMNGHILEEDLNRLYTNQLTVEKRGEK